MTERELPQDIRTNYDTLYHAFPRRAVGSPEVESQQGLRILDGILKRGLIITPEVTEWRLRKSGQPTFTAQKRVCFTALRPNEFTDHAKQFGSFALGFDRSALESLGATPVFYVPRYLPDGGKGRNIGSFYIERLLQIQLFLDNNPKSFRIGDDPVTTQELSQFTRFLTGLFYPVEDLESDSVRTYFSQKEWRILGNLFIGKRPLSRPLTDDEKAEIASVDANFFHRQVRLATGSYRMIDQCAVIDEVDGAPLRTLISQVIAPERDKAAICALLEKYHVHAPIEWQSES
jgi:hypothetical protein